MGNVEARRLANAVEPCRDRAINAEPHRQHTPGGMDQRIPLRIGVGGHLASTGRHQRGEDDGHSEQRCRHEHPAPLGHHGSNPVAGQHESQ